MTRTTDSAFDKQNDAIRVEQAKERYKNPRITNPDYHPHDWFKAPIDPVAAAIYRKQQLWCTFYKEALDHGIADPDIYADSMSGLTSADLAYVSKR